VVCNISVINILSLTGSLVPHSSIQSDSEGISSFLLSKSGASGTFGSGPVNNSKMLMLSSNASSISGSVTDLYIAPEFVVFLFVVVSDLVVVDDGLVAAIGNCRVMF
jgi:hypothetical protein